MVRPTPAAPPAVPVTTSIKETPRHSSPLTALENRTAALGRTDQACLGAGSSMYFRVLGDIALTDGAHVVPVTGVRRRRVLAHLLAQPNAVVPLDRLIAGAWPGTPPASAVNSLQSHVSRLRRAIGPDRLLHSSGGYLLVVDDDELDTGRFERLLCRGRTELAEGRPEDAATRLREALALWAGDPFAEFASEPFVEARVADLTEQRRASVEVLVQARLELGEHRELCAELESLTTQNPLRERPWEQRMLALYRSGRQAEALDIYGQVRRVLGEELGIDPGRDLTRMHEAVLNHRADLDWRPPAPPPAPGRAPTGKTLLEREDELLALHRAVSDAAAGRPSVTLLEAPAGSGKSALLGEAARLGRQYAVKSLIARGQPLERSFAFGFVRQLLEPEVRGIDPDDLFTGPASAARVVFHHSTEDAAPEDPFAVINGLYWLVVGLAERNPLVLLADDAHLADEPSQRLLAFLHPRIDGTRVALVVATRPAYEVGEQAPTLAPLWCDGEVRRLRPEALTPAATEALVAATLGDAIGDRLAEVGEECHRLTGGNPLFLNQVLSELRARGVPAGEDTVMAPAARESVGRIVLGRLAALPADCRRVVQVLAVLGDGARLDLAARAAGLAPAQMAAAVERLARAAILSHERKLTFEHPIVREAVHAHLGASQAAEEHLRVARVLHEAGVDDEQVALHLVQARGGDGPWVADVLGRTGRSALVSGAPRVALEHLRRALGDAAPDSRPELLVDLGQAEGAVGDPACLGTLEAALETARLPETVLAAGLALGAAYVIHGRACLEAARGLATEHGYVAVQEVVAQRLGGQPDPARLRRR